MAADEKTEKATPKRKQEERKKGNVFQSSDVAAVATLLAVFNGLKLFASFMYECMHQGVLLFFGYAQSEYPVNGDNLQEKLLQAMLLFAQAALPLLLVACVTAVVVAALQTRMAFSMETIKFKANRISPLQGFKRLFSVRSLVELLKALIKITVLGWMIYSFLSSRMHEFVRLMDGTVMDAIAFAGDTVLSLVNTVGIAFLFLAAFDYLYQWWEYEKNLRMSKQEIKEEYKQTEGDPQIKGKIREKQRQMSSRRMMQNVPKADVIIRNPTHFAVALGYDPQRNKAPVVLAKGADRVALKIVEIGEANDVYIMENRPLARGLYDAAEIDMEIPGEFYQAVAGVLAFVYKLKKEK